MSLQQPDFHVAFAQTSDDIRAVQRLRYDVFVKELGADGALVDHDQRTESDRYDAAASHLMLRDITRAEDDQVVGVYRLMNAAQAADVDGFSCAEEYDISALRASGKRLLELGRSCVHPDYRGSTAMFHLWQALSAHVTASQTDVLFGVASFHGPNAAQHKEALNMLFDRHKSTYPVISRQPARFEQGSYDRKKALQQMPALIKAYLRLGGTVGQGAFVDHAFNTTDVCMILDVDGISARQKAIYAK